MKQLKVYMKLINMLLRKIISKMIKLDLKFKKCIC